MTHLKRPWCWERLKAGGEGDDRGWDGWHHWLNGHELEWTRIWWWIGRPGVLQSTGSKELDMTEWVHFHFLSYRIDWFDLTVQGTLKSLLQHHSSRASGLQCSAFFMGQISQYYMTTGKTIALTRWTLVGKGMSLLFNMLSKFVIAFLPRSKCLLISHLQSPSTVILEPKKIKSATAYTFSPSICHEVMGPDAMILVF